MRSGLVTFYLCWQVCPSRALLEPREKIRGSIEKNQQFAAPLYERTSKQPTQRDGSHSTHRMISRRRRNEPLARRHKRSRLLIVPPLVGPLAQQVSVDCGSSSCTRHRCRWVGRLPVKGQFVAAVRLQSTSFLRLARLLQRHRCAYTPRTNVPSRPRLPRTAPVHLRHRPHPSSRQGGSSLLARRHGANLDWVAPLQYARQQDELHRLHSCLLFMRRFRPLLSSRSEPALPALHRCCREDPADLSLQYPD